MPISSELESCFKPEERARGEDLVEAVNVSSSSDTTVRASIRASGAPRVSLTADDVTSAELRAECSCPPFKRGVLCKHVWATLLALDARDADILNAKTDVTAVAKASPEKNKAPAAARPANDAYKAKQAARAAEYKERAKAMRRERKGLPPKTTQVAHPAEVEESLAYFNENGFDLAQDLELEKVLEAKRALSRIFHPDRGGSHDEAIALNHHFDILAGYLG